MLALMYNSYLGVAQEEVTETLYGSFPPVGGTNLRNAFKVINKMDWKTCCSVYIKKI